MADAVTTTEQSAPPAVTEKPSVPQFGANLDNDIRATERIEMQRVTAMVYAANQRAIQYPRNEKQCFDKIMTVCENVHFASDAMYKVPRGNQKVEGLNVKAMREFARIWGNLQTGVVSHGSYGNLSQFACLAIDLESNYIHGTEYTVEHARWISAKDGDSKEVRERGGQLKPVYDPQSVGEICKATNSKERRNAIQALLPHYVIEAAKAQIKRTLHQAVTDVPGAWESCKLQFAKWGVSGASLARYLNKSISECPQKLDAADIVDLRLLKDGIKEEPSLLNEIFPERDRSKVPNLPAKEGDQSSTENKATSAKPSAAKPTSASGSKNSESSTSSNQQSTPASSSSQASSKNSTTTSSSNPSSAPSSKNATTTEPSKTSTPASSTASQKPSTQKPSAKPETKPESDSKSTTNTPSKPTPNSKSESDDPPQQSESSAESTHQAEPGEILSNEAISNQEQTDFSPETEQSEDEQPASEEENQSPSDSEDESTQEQEDDSEDLDDQLTDEDAF